MSENKPTFLTRVAFDTVARQELFKGLEIAAEAVTCTLGPKGKTVIISNPAGHPIVTKDGVTVSRAIRLKDPLQRMGAELVQEAASQTNDTAGDGTTTSTLLTYVLVKEGLKLIENGSDRTKVIKGIQGAVKNLIVTLKANAKQISSKNELANIATISANGDRVIGNLIADALDKVGANGIVTVEDAKGIATTVAFAEGMLIERGFVSPYFINTPEKQAAIHQNAWVLIVESKLSQMKPLIPILESAVNARMPLLIIADDIEGEALHTLVVNRTQSNLPLVAIKSPGYGTLKEQLLQDIAVFTGATIIGPKTGVNLEKATTAQLGSVKKLMIDNKSTTLIAAGKTDEAIQQRAGELQKQLIDITLSIEDVHKIRTRLARLTSGAAVIKVGGMTEIEMIERKHRIEDALNATRAAAEEGIVAGGGHALFKASRLYFDFPHDHDETLGVKAVLKTCEAPIQKIVANAGLSPDIVIHKMDETSLGYDAANDRYVDMLVEGIIDPLKVTRTALENAASVANIFLSLDAAVIED